MASMELLLPPSAHGPPNLPNSVSARSQAPLPNMPNHSPEGGTVSPNGLVHRGGVLRGREGGLASA